MANKGTITGDEVLKGVNERIQQVDADFKKLLVTYNEVAKQLTQTTNINGIEAVIKKTNAANKEQIALSKQLALQKSAEANAVIKEEKAKQAAANETANTIKKEADARKAVTSAKAAEVNLNNKLQTQANKTNSYYKQQSALLNKLRDSYKSLELKKQNGIALSKTEEVIYGKLATRVKALDASLKQADAAAGQFNRNVGNYKSGVQGLATSFRSLLGAFGFTSGIYLFASALKDAFSRVRDFDKSMQNLAGVLGTTRSQIAPIEKEVLAVAGASVKTSREVGELAEVLATLGNKGQDLINLIKPANELSIALEATSAEAAEFLVQTLNAFGEPTTSANKFANTISAIRTSTSLDFQRMADSFQYITPISRILNKDLAETGALIGVLSDNGIKAQQAGRLLGTAIQKLAAEGNTLEGALKEINEAQESGIEGYDLLTVANKLFGAEAAKLGIILSNNSGDLESNAQAIRDNATAMDDLVKQQLESLDAKIKILDSTWEQLILTIDNGSGSISNFFKGAIRGTTAYLNELLEVERAQSEVFLAIGKNEDDVLTFWDKTKTLVNGLTFNLTNLKTSYDKLEASQRDFNNYLDNINGETSISFLSDEIKTLNNEIENNSDLSDDQIKLLERQRDAVTEVYEQNKNLRTSLEEQAREIVKTSGKFEDFGRKIDILSNDQLQNFINTNKDVAKSLDTINEAFENLDVKSIDALNAKLSDLNKRRNAIDTTKDREEFNKLTKEIKETQAELDRILGKGGVAQKAIIQGSVQAYQDLINKLTELRDGTATSTAEWQKYDDQIAQTERKITQLKEGIDSLQTATIARLPPITFTGNVNLDSPDQVEIQKGITLQIAKEKERERAILKSINDGILADYHDFTDEQTSTLKSALDFQLDLRQKQEDAVADLVVGGLDTVFQARIDNIDKQLDANQNLLDTVLNSEEASDEQKLIQQKKADKEEARLLKEREKREKQAFLVQQGLALAQIAIDLAKTISAINLAAASIDAVTFGIGGTAYRAANIPLAIGTSALQTGLVLAQSIPAFFRGKEASNNYEGDALLNDGGRDEVLVSGKGDVERLKGRNIVRNIKKDDIVAPSVSNFNRQINDPTSDIYQRVASRLTKDTSDRQNMIVVNSQTDTKGIEKAISNAMSKHKAPVYRPNIVIQQPRRSSY